MGAPTAFAAGPHAIRQSLERTARAALLGLAYSSFRHDGIGRFTFTRPLYLQKLR